MKYHAEFFQIDLAGKLSPACGDRSVIILDGRISEHSMRCIAADECKRRGYVAYRVNRGESFTRCTHGTIHRVDHLTELTTISNRLNAGA